MTDRVRQLVKELDQWSPCMSYNDSYFGEPPGMLKQTIRQLVKELDATKDITDMSTEELQQRAINIIRNSAANKIEERIRIMEMVNQITDPNVRLPLKYILENLP